MRPRARRMVRDGVRCGAILLLSVLLLLPVARAQTKGAPGQVFSQEELCRQDFQTGQEFLKNRRLTEAAQAFGSVVEACPGMIEAYLNLGLIQVQLREYEEAIDTYSDALDVDPANLDVKVAMAYALSSAGDLDEAASLYLEVHAARPDDLDILQNLAFVYRQKGLIAESVMLYDKLIEAGAATPQMVSEAGGMALEHKLFLPAVSFYRKLYEFNPADVNTLSILGGYYFKTKFYEQAVPYYDRILEIEPQHEKALMFHQIRGLCLKNTKQLTRAAEDYEFVVAQQPDEVTNFCNLAFIYKDAALFEKAEGTIRRGLDRHPGGGCLYYAWGLVLEGRGSSLIGAKQFVEGTERFREAKTKFQKVVDLADANFRNAAGQQLGRMDALIERAMTIQEKEEANR